jgi:hypothetical protein
MADIQIKTRSITRDQITALVGNNPRAVRLMEALTSDVGVTLPDAIADVVAVAAEARAAALAAQTVADALNAMQFVALAASAGVANERVLAAGANISITDGGPGGPVTVSVALADIIGTALPMTITPKAPTSAETPGALNLLARDAVGGSLNGGTINITAGAGNAGGAIVMTAGGGNVSGGDISFTAGDGDSAGALIFHGGSGINHGGDVTFSGGNAAEVGANAGALFFLGGDSVGGNGGSITMASGVGEASGGPIYIKSGSGSTYAIHVQDDGVNTQIGLYGAAPVARPTTSTASATFVAGTGTAINSASTFDGYTIGKVVKALRNVGILT